MVSFREDLIQGDQVALDKHRVNIIRSKSSLPAVEATKKWGMLTFELHT